jgi:hypothetical protein
VGNYAAELFDFYRGSTVETKKLGLSLKTCTQLVASVDKTNHHVNIVAGTAALVSLIFLALLLRRSRSKALPQWPVSWKRKLQVAKADDNIPFTQRSNSQAPFVQRTTSKYTAAPSGSFDIHPAAQAVSVTPVAQLAPRTPAAQPVKQTFTFQQSQPTETSDIHAAALYGFGPSSSKASFSFQDENPSSTTPLSANSSFADLYYTQSQPEEQVVHEQVVLKPNRRKSLPALEAEPAPKTPRLKSTKSSKLDLKIESDSPRLKSSKSSLKIESDSGDWSPLTAESLAKSSGSKTPSQMIGGIDVASVINTPRRRSASAALGSVPSVKKTKSGL